MYDKIKDYFYHILFTSLACLFVWNLYTVSFHGYVTNGFWETYYEEEPKVFIVDCIEIFGMYIPLFVLLYFHILDIIADIRRANEQAVSSVTKAKRLRRKKRKRKRKQ